MRLTKHHGLGNDFLVLLDGAADLDAAALARAACDRRRGIGADGLIVARVVSSAGASDTGADGPGEVVMELRNADGSRAEMSGNGIRCLGQAVVDAGRASGPELRVYTDAGVRHLSIGSEVRPGLRQVTVDMGPARVVAAEPGRAEVDTGNPHLVLLVRRLDEVDLDELGRRHPDVNVEVLAPGPEPDTLVMRVHERGVGITQACGTGSCAVAVAARGWGLVGDRVVVHNPGGPVTVDLKADTVLLTGPAEYVGRVELPWPPAPGEGAP